jgi:hypothetical protein
MGGALVIGFAIGGTALYVGWRRVRVFAQYLRYRESANRFEQSMKIAREEMERDQVIRVASAEDAELVEMIDAATSERAAIEASGFTYLGDVVVDVKDARAAALARVFADSARTTLAILAVHGSRPRRWSLAFITYRGDEQLTTERSSGGGLAQPPFVKTQTLPAETSDRELLEKHRVFASPDGATRMTAVEDVAAAMERVRAASLRWRAGLSPDELLDADLEAVLGEQYERTGKMWARRLRERIPDARLHRG